MTDLIQRVVSSPGNVTISSAVEGSEVFALAELARGHTGGVVHITLNDSHMQRVAESLAFFAPDVEVLELPAWDCIPYDRVSPNNNVISQRLHTLSQLLFISKQPEERSQSIVIITTVNAAIQRVIPQTILTESTLNLQKGDAIQRDVLTAFLVQSGYVHSGIAAEPGEFALRGSLVDIFPSGDSQGYRLDFFGDTLETIRIYDPLTQISGTLLGSLVLIPASEVILNEDTIRHFRHQYRELFGTVIKEDPLYESVSAGRKYAGIEHWLPLFYEQLDSVLDYVPDALVTVDHLVEASSKEREALIYDSYETRNRHDVSLVKTGGVYHPIPPERLYLLEEDLRKEFEGRSVVTFFPYARPEESERHIVLPYRATIDFAAEAKGKQKSAFELVREALADSVERKLIPVIACMSEGSRSRLRMMLEQADIPSVDIDGWEARKRLRRKPGRVGLIILRLEHGFITDELILITEQDILGERIFRKQRKKEKASTFLAESAALSEGELVVHKDHGIGRFDGLQTLVVDALAHDCLRLLYAGGDRLFVPVENIDLVSRYGADSEEVQLDKLGAESWQKRRSKLKKRIQITAGELLDVAAKRALHTAAKFHRGDDRYQAFCARFPYVETEDQERVIEEVNEDLSSGKPMDRLVCGDVGFGKTEVALRAAHVIVSPETGEEKGQVALITPTTLLCRQHYQTFCDRYAGLGISIRQLSRLTTSNENQETKRMLEDGDVDIVIGTHALLAKDVTFKNLALLIVDEEQHFGVEQKEKLKRLRTNTHVLTLTATPIPRTLQLSLSGIRDLSLIATPPVDRLAVRTYVMPYDDVVVREAVLREHYRGGQVFYVCPRIKDVEELEQPLRALVPEVKIVTAHGRMSPSELDDIMQAFYDRKFDVLLSTTIIESGLDVPTANTLIVHRAEMYGLAQLYQLRGRVGRSKVRAYAYLTLPAHKIPTKQAQKRLEVMQKLDSLGAGFSLASHDMDIRGFGNLLGDEQSGQIKEVGLELYQHMLTEAIEAAKATDEETINEAFSPQINLGTSVLIPEEYVPDLQLRLGLYRRIANLKTDEEVEAMAAELVDRFGTLPVEVDNLFTVVKVKQMCRLAGISHIEAGSKGAVIGFYQDTFAKPDALIRFATQHSNQIKLRADHKVILLNRDWKHLDNRLHGIRESLEQIASLAA